LAALVLAAGLAIAAPARAGLMDTWSYTTSISNTYYPPDGRAPFDEHNFFAFGGAGVDHAGFTLDPQNGSGLTGSTNVTLLRLGPKYLRLEAYPAYDFNLPFTVSVGIHDDASGQNGTVTLAGQATGEIWANGDYTNVYPFPVGDIQLKLHTTFDGPKTVSLGGRYYTVAAGDFDPLSQTVSASVIMSNTPEPATLTLAALGGSLTLVVKRLRNRK
jgi:hypothetical protein